MTESRVVSNSSVLIALSQIAQLDLLQRLFGGILIPPAVGCEIRREFVPPAWMVERTPGKPAAIVLPASLGPGESEAINLAIEISAEWVILDDRPARRLAVNLGLPVIGTMGILLEAKRRGFLPAVRPCLDALLNRQFRVSAQLYKNILRDAGETLT